MKFVVVWLSLLLFISACKPGYRNSDKTVKRHADSFQDSIKSVFSLPEVPAVITGVRERNDYMAANYWKNFDFSNTGFLKDMESISGIYIDYMDLLARIEENKAADCLKKLIRAAEKNTEIFDFFYTMSEQYLYHPNSPYRNEELYIALLEEIVNSRNLSHEQKARPEFQLKIALRNRVGTKAADFVYLTKEGRKSRLYSVKSTYLLLYFYNPDCDACRIMTEELKDASVISELILKNILKIIAVYPDRDIKAWKNHLKEFPEDWTVAYEESHSLNENKIYDLKAMPTLYLLDSDKNVLLKDAPSYRVIRYLAGRNPVL